MAMRCDGLWLGDDHTSCEAPILLECGCSRCEREEPDERFYACADHQHQRIAGDRHYWVHDRIISWCIVT